jgi:aspartate aminotransferase-like enzyme
MPFSVQTAGATLSKYTLFTPGPVDIPEDILQETARKSVYHREAQFAELFRTTSEGLKHILGTSGRLFLFASSGTGAMEAACSNILSSTDEPVVAVCGKFGERWLELCQSYRIKPVIVKEEYGCSIKPEAIEAVLKQKTKPPVVFTTLTETSTGALNDIRAFGEITKKYGAFLVVDGVAGIAADPCPQDEWHVDILIGASQKALMSPPGISFIAVNERAFERTQKSDLPTYYFNLAICEKFRIKNQTPWTPAINVLYGLSKGISTIVQVGLEETYARHRGVAGYVRERVRQMGFETLPRRASNALTVVKMPEHLTSTDIIGELKENHGILFANGQGELRGKILRIGHMGDYTKEKMRPALDALEHIVKR